MGRTHRVDPAPLLASNEETPDGTRRTDPGDRDRPGVLPRGGGQDRHRSGPRPVAVQGRAHPRRLLAGGIVRIEIPTPGFVDTELSERLRRAYGLRHAIVVTEASADIGSLRAALGRASAGLLTEMITE